MSSIDTALSRSNAPQTTAAHYNRWNLKHTFGGIGIHIVLLAYTLLAVFPIALTIINSFKKQGDIFGHPYTIPTGSMFALIGYQHVFQRAEAFVYL